MFSLLWMHAPLARAECLDTEKAGTAYDLGERALQSRNVELAVSNFREANRLCPDPNTQLAIATAYLMGRRVSQAQDALNRYIAAAAVSTDWCRVVELRRQLALLEGQSEHKLTVNVSPRSARVFLREAASVQPEGVPGCQVQPTEEGLTIQLPTGRYTVTAVLEQQAPRAVVVDLRNPGPMEIWIPSAPPEPLPRKQSPLPLANPPATIDTREANSTSWDRRPENWIWIGSGVVGAASAVLGIWALSLESDLDQSCAQQRRCGEADWGRVDKHDKLATISTVGFVAASLGAVAGATAYLWRRHSEKQSGVSMVSCSVGAAQVTLNGRF